MHIQHTYPEVITFGETMALLMSPLGKGLEFSTTLHTSFGGAESNVAIGLARLGHHAGWFGHLGDDPLGHMILKRIRGEGVDVSRATCITGQPTGLMLRESYKQKSSVYYYRKYSAASQMRPEHLDAHYIAQAKILHITGITPALSESARKTLFQAIHIAREAGVKISFDPNLRLKLWSIEDARHVILEIAACADYFLPGLDELKMLYELDHWDDIVRKLHELNAISIVKSGSIETHVVTKQSTQAVPCFPVNHVIDTVGAGDGFSAGFLAGILRGYEDVHAVQIGNLVGSMVVQVEGDWEGIPTWSEVEAVLHQTKHIER